MNTNLKNLALAALVLFVVGFAFGRFSNSGTKKTETQTSQTEQTTQGKQTNTDIDRHKETTTTEVTRPDGTKEVTTKTVEDSTAKKTSNTETKSSETLNQTVKTETTKGANPVTVSVLAGPNISFSDGFGPMIYGLHITRPIIGPVTVGLWGMTNKTAGVSIGLTF